jgi:MYXO-CTERM domain-containing protein
MPTPVPAQPAPSAAAPAQRVPARPAAPEQGAPTPAQRQPAGASQRTAAEVPATDEAEPDRPAPDAAPPAVPPPPADAPAAPVEPPAPVAAEPGSGWLWIVGAALALAAVAGAFWWRMRRRPQDAEPEAEPVAAPDDRPAPPAPAAPVAPAPAVPPAPQPVAPAPAIDRPWIDMDLFVAQARFSLMGVTIAYRLTLHNRGSAAARDVMVRGIVGNAGAQQQALLEAFFSGADGLPLHSAVGIAPGETVQLTGDLRLPPDRIVPVTMGERQLLIPIAAFDAGYRWGAEEDEPAGQGRTARAFIVGQEQEPPADRLAPLRLDQGPRQYRRPAARAAAELTPA